MKDVFMSEDPIYVSPTLAGMFGAKTAIFLQELHCWLQERRIVVDGQLWIEGDLDAWGTKLPFLAPRTIRNCAKRLLRHGLLEVSLRDGVEWYALSCVQLARQVAAYQARHGNGRTSPMAVKGGEAL